MKVWSLKGMLMFGIVVILFGMAIHAPLIVVGERLFPDGAFVIKAWKELLMVLLSVLALILLVRQRKLKPFLAEWPIRLGLAYVALHVLLAVIIPTELLPKVAGLMIDLRFVAFFMLCYAAAILYGPLLPKIGLRAVAAGAAVVLGFGLLQITLLPDDALRGIGYAQDTIRPFTTIDSNTDYVRINSTLRGPNPLGAITVVYVALAVAYLAYRRRWDNRAAMAGLVAAASIAVMFASYSRSAYLAAVVAIGALIMMALRKYVTPLRLGVAGVVGVILIVGLFQLRSTDWFSNVVLHEDPESTVVSKSNDEHIASLIEGTERKLDQPFGAGVGSTGSAVVYGEASSGPTIENIYLFIAHESGWLGLGLFLALYGLIMKRLFDQRRVSWVAAGLFASGIGLALIGMLLPVWTDDTVALIWWGLAGGILGSGYGKRTRQQETTGTA